MLLVTSTSAFPVHPKIKAFIPWYSCICFSAYSREKQDKELELLQTMYCMLNQRCIKCIHSMQFKWHICEDPTFFSLFTLSWTCWKVWPCSSVSLVTESPRCLHNKGFCSQNSCTDAPNSASDRLQHSHSSHRAWTPKKQNKQNINTSGIKRIYRKKYILQIYK